VDLHLGHSECRTADKRVGVGVLLLPTITSHPTIRPSNHPTILATDANDEAAPILMVVANTLEAIAGSRVRSWLLLTQQLFCSLQAGLVNRLHAE